MDVVWISVGNETLYEHTEELIKTLELESKLFESHTQQDFGYEVPTSITIGTKFSDGFTQLLQQLHQFLDIDSECIKLCPQLSIKNEHGATINGHLGHNLEDTYRDLLAMKSWSVRKSLTPTDITAISVICSFDTQNFLSAAISEQEGIFDILVKDPLELSVINASSAPNQLDGSVITGSIKSKIGQLESCVGLAGRVKSVLTFKHAKKEPRICLQTLRPETDWSRVQALRMQALLINRASVRAESHQSLELPSTFRSEHTQSLGDAYGRTAFDVIQRWIEFDPHSDTEESSWARAIIHEIYHDLQGSKLHLHHRKHDINSCSSTQQTGNPIYCAIPSYDSGQPSSDRLQKEPDHKKPPECASPNQTLEETYEIWALGAALLSVLLWVCLDKEPKGQSQEEPMPSKWYLLARVQMTLVSLWRLSNDHSTRRVITTASLLTYGCTMTYLANKPRSHRQRGNLMILLVALASGGCAVLRSKNELLLSLLTQFVPFALLAGEAASLVLDRGQSTTVSKSAVGLSIMS